MVLIPEGVTEVERAVDRCEEWQSLAELTGLLRRYGRA
jgi:hypothetical protein